MLQTDALVFRGIGAEWEWILVEKGFVGHGLWFDLRRARRRCKPISGRKSIAGDPRLPCGSWRGKCLS